MMTSAVHATSAFEERQRHAAELSVLVAKINATPEDVAPVTDAFLRVLEIAAASPGGQPALIDGLAHCAQVGEVLAFCKMFVNVIAIDNGVARHPFGGAYINAVHDEGVPA